MARETRPSLQDHLRMRQEDEFVGRVAQIGDYQQNLGIPPGNKRHRFVFNIYGDAGVGKTSLTERLRQIAVDQGYLAACVDDQRADDAISAMSVIADEFSQNRARLSEFQKRLAAYHKHRHTLESDPQAPDGVAALVTKAAVAIGISAARSAPVAGGVLAQVDPAAVGDQVNQARAYLARKFKDHADVRLLLAPESELTSAFVAGLNRIGADRPIALFFDSYERTGLFLDRWLLGLYSAQYGGLPEKLIITISGQNQLDQNLWHKYRPIIADMPLKPFSEAEARQFLASKDIRDESRVGDWRGCSLALGPGAFVAAGFPAGCATPVSLARSAPFPVPATSNRACGSPAHGSPTPFTAGIRPSPPVPEGPGIDDDS